MNQHDDDRHQVTDDEWAQIVARITEAGGRSPEEPLGSADEGSGGTGAGRGTPADPGSDSAEEASDTRDVDGANSGGTISRGTDSGDDGSDDTASDEMSPWEDPHDDRGTQRGLFGPESDGSAQLADEWLWETDDRDRPEAAAASGEAAIGANESPDEDEGFVPPEPPPIGLATASPFPVLGWLAALGGPAFILVTVFFWRNAPTLAILGAIGVFLFGVVTLVLQMPSRRDGDDDGAVV